MTVSLLMAVVIPVSAAPFSEYVEEAKSSREAGDLGRAVELMNQAVEEYPDSAMSYAYLGLYLGMQAGATDNFMEAGRLVTKAFSHLDHAVRLDPSNPRARLYRGSMGVNVPEFLGHLDQGIEDLEMVLAAYDKSPATVPVDLAIAAAQLLGQGLEKQEDYPAAAEALEIVVRLAPGTQAAEAAEKELSRIENLAAERPAGESELAEEDLENMGGESPDDPEALAKLGKTYYQQGKFENAARVLGKAIDMETTDPDAYRYMVMIRSGEMSEDLYDSRIYENTDWATNLAFEIAGYLDRAVELAPEDMELRLMRGQIGVQFPFFTGMLERALADLEMVTESTLPAEDRAEATYWLGFGYAKLGMSFMTRVVTEFENEEAMRMALRSMRPNIERLDEESLSRPAVIIEFELGFRDELPPQVAVWIENGDGDFLRTIYVSGFSGNVKERQIVLPVWASTSEFADADAVTAASIDVGQHVYVWDLRDGEGREVPSGEYRIMLETMHWPSNRYQMVTAPIQVGDQPDRVVVREGDYIPYAGVRYLP
jgi:tetratricopeptide (TPR) repeat protein